MDILSDPSRLVGNFTCPHDDGDFELKVIDLHNWATDNCLVVMEGQGQKNDMVLTREEAAGLAAILIRFALGTPEL